MNVYALLHNDRHADPEVAVFRTREAAMEEAHRRLFDPETCNRFGDAKSNELNSSMKADGWIFYGTYGESDSIRVEEKVLR